MWMVTAALFWTFNTILIRPVAETMPPLQLMFLRTLFSALILLPYLWRTRWVALRTTRLRLHLGRSCLVYGSMLMWIYSIVHLPIGEAVTLGFTSPLVVTLLAALVLGEHVGIRRWSAVIIGFIGALIIIRPGFASLDPAVAYPLLNATLWAVAVILARRLTTTEAPITIVAYMFIILTPITLVPALFVWQEPTTEALLLTVVLAATLVLAQIATMRALSVAEASIVIPVEYVQLPVATYLAYLVFDEVPDPWMPLGAAIIIIAVIYNSHREVVRARQGAKAETGLQPP
jgi:drug/metabolite transporter (DMT)-like permease